MKRFRRRFVLASMLSMLAASAIQALAASAPDRIRIGLSSYTPINAAV